MHGDHGRIKRSNESWMWMKVSARGSDASECTLRRCISYHLTTSRQPNAVTAKLSQSQIFDPSMPRNVASIVWYINVTNGITAFWCAFRPKLEKKCPVHWWKQLSLAQMVYINAHTKYNKLATLFAVYWNRQKWKCNKNRYMICIHWCTFCAKYAIYISMIIFGVL